MERKLAAILAADVVGFSRMMETDEAGTMRVLKARRKEILEPLVAKYKGRLFKLAGDGALVEFASAVHAVDCAVELQRAMAEANKKEAANEHAIVLRIGVNLGDVMVEGSDLYGDGVNIASRLEGLAEPGRILVSGTAYDHVKNKVKVSFDDLGPHALKNMAEAVRVFRVAGAPFAAPEPAKRNAEKPSIAVLPFANMSGDPEQEYLSDGISEDIITELSKFHSLFVISRNSSFAFKGQSVNLAEVSHRLKARYIVEGSVRRAGARLRITAQLIDASDDTHLWAERYDRELTDMFELQDEVVRAIVTAIEPNLLSSERNRALRKPPENLDAWENYQRGLWHTFQYKPTDRELTLKFFDRAVALDPSFAPAYAGLAYALYVYIILGAAQNRIKDVDRALEAGKTAVRLDDHDPFGWSALARAHLLGADHEAAIATSDIAITLSPNFALAHFGRAHALWHAGRPAEAVVSHDEALKLSPLDPLIWAYLASKAIALVMLGRFEEAIELSRRSQSHARSAIFSHLAEISALGHLGFHAEARDAIERARGKMPKFSVAYIEETFPITNEACRQIFIDGFLKAGVPLTLQDAT